MDDMTLNPVLATVCAAIFAIIILLHILPLVFKGKAFVVLSYVCVGLHAPLMPLMLFAGFTLEVMILAYAVSAFVHTLGRYIAHELEKRKVTPDKAEEEVAQ